MTLKEFLLKYCSKFQMISVAEVKDDGIRLSNLHWEYVDSFLDNELNSELFDREIVEIFCGRGEVMHINVKGE